MTDPDNNPASEPVVAFGEDDGSTPFTPHHNDLLLIRDAQEYERVEQAHSLIRDLLAGAAMLLAGFAIITVWAGNGLLPAAATLFMLSALLAALLYGGWLWWQARARVLDELYRQVAAAIGEQHGALTHGRGVPGGGLLLEQFRALGLIAPYRARLSSHWLGGRLFGAKGQVFQTAAWRWAEPWPYPVPVFTGLMARFESGRHMEGALHLSGDGSVREGSNLDLAKRILSPGFRTALAAVAARYPETALKLACREGLMFLTIDLGRPWYKLPGLFHEETGIAHIRAIFADLEALWRLGAALEADHHADWSNP